MNKKIFQLIALLVPVFCLFFFLSAPYALADIDQIDVTKEDYRPEIVVDIGGFNSQESFNMPSPAECPPGGGTNCVSIDWLANYIAVIYRYGIGLAGILAAVMIIIGGFLWLSSFGSPDKISKAKEYITGALTGLLLALFSYLILYTVNPALVANRALVISAMKPLETEQGPQAASECCCATDGFERGCAPKTCDNVCATAGRQYYPYNCSKVGNSGVTINEGGCAAEQIASKCCCATDGLERGCAPTQCVQSSCDKSGRKFVPERTCTELRVTIDEGVCKN